VAVNDGISRPMAAEVVPGVRNPMTTGAGAGSQGGQVTASTGDLASVPVSVLGQSSQVPVDVGRVDYNDTAGGSSDDPVTIWTTGEAQSSPAWGSPVGHVSGDHHPRAS
jgi:hypothetical protein